jgi:AraC-like DNA-binding protein
MKQNGKALFPEDNLNLEIAPAPEPRGVVVRGMAEPADDAQSEGARRIERCITYMKQHLSQPLCIAKLAQTANISSSHFFVLFKRWVGFSPIEYFIRLRMQRAGELLASTTLSVKEVAAALGYDDPFYFSRLFKSVHGVAPSDYRLMMDELKRTDNHEGIRPDEPATLSAPMSAEMPRVLQKTKVV